MWPALENPSSEFLLSSVNRLGWIQSCSSTPIRVVSDLAEECCMKKVAPSPEEFLSFCASSSSKPFCDPQCLYATTCIIIIHCFLQCSTTPSTLCCCIMKSCWAQLASSRCLGLLLSSAPANSHARSILPARWLELQQVVIQIIWRASGWQRLF